MIETKPKAWSFHWSDKLSQENDNLFNEIITSLSAGWQIKKARATLRAINQAAWYIYLMIDTLEETNEDLEEFIIKTLDSLHAMSELFVSVAEEWDDMFLDEDDDEDSDES